MSNNLENNVENNVKNNLEIPHNHNHKRTKSFGTMAPFSPKAPDNNLCVITIGNKTIQFYLDSNPGKTNIQTSIDGYKIHISNNLSNSYTSIFCSNTSNTSNTSNNTYDRNHSPKFYYPSAIRDPHSIFDNAKPMFPNGAKHSDIEPFDSDIFW